MDFSKNNLLFITPHFPPNNTIGTQRILKMTKYLSKKGWKIFVLTVNEGYFENQKSNYDFYLDNLNVQVERINAVSIFHLPGKIKSVFGKSTKKSDKARTAGNLNKVPKQKSKKKKFPHNLVSFITEMIQYPDAYLGFSIQAFLKLRKMIKANQIKYVFVSSPPHSIHFPVNILRKFTRFNYISDFRDPWTFSQWKKKEKLSDRLKNRLDKFFEKQTLKMSDKVIFNTEMLLKVYQKHFPKYMKQNKLHSLYNGYDPDQLLHSEYIPDPQKIKILHTGTLYKQRDPGVILEGYQKFLEADPESARKIQIKFIGKLSKDFTYLPEHIKHKKLHKNIIFEETQPYETVMEEAQNSDWLILLQPATKIQIPAKLFDYLLLNKPIWAVVEPGSDAENLIKNMKQGIVSDCNSVDQIVSFFKSLTNYKFEPDTNYVRKFEVPNLVDKFEQILNGKS